MSAGGEAPLVGVAPVARWLPLYALLVVVWGSAFVFMRMGLDALTPLGLAIGRLWAAAATLVLISLVTRTPFPPRSVWKHLAIYGAMTATVPWIAISFAISHITTSLAGIIGSSSALWVLVIILLFFREERPASERIIGLVVGFLGILTVLGVWKGVGGGTLTGIAVMTAGLIVFAFSLPYSRRHLAGGSRAVDLPPISVATGALVFAALLSLPLVPFVTLSDGPVTMTSLSGVLAVGVLSSGLGTMLMLFLVRLTDATTTSTASYCVPLVAIALGVTVMGEEVTWNELLGGVLILVGAAMAQGLLHVRAVPRRRWKPVDREGPQS